MLATVLFSLAQSQTQVGDFTFHTRILANGVRTAAVQDLGAADGEHAGKASIFVVVAAGNRDETAETTGLAHLTEHALFTGTAKTGDDEHDRIVIEELGGESNASTRDDYTIYYDHLIPVSALDRVLAMEVDRMANLIWDEKAVLHERERLRIEEQHTWTPATTRQEQLEHAVYRKEGYRHGLRDEEGHTLAPTLGVPVIREFYERWYRPQFTTVLVVTPGDPAEALAAIEKAFGSWQEREPKFVPKRASEKPPLGPRTLRFASGLAQQRVELCWVVPPRAHTDSIKLAALATFFDRVKTSTGETFQAAYEERQGSSLFRIAANGPDAEQEIRSMLKRVIESSFLDDEDALGAVWDVLPNRFSSLPLRARPYFSVAAEFARFYAYGEEKILADWQPKISEDLEPAELVGPWMNYLRPEWETKVIFLPAKDPAAARELPTDTSALAKFAQDAGEAGEYQLAVRAYTELLARKPNRMNTVIYLATRGQLHMDREKWDAAIADFEEALTVVDYPAVRELLKEAKQRKATGGN